MRSASPTVIYIANVLSDRVRSGAYRSGQRLPPEREIAKEFGVSRTLVRQAVDQLVSRNLAERVPRCRAVVRHELPGAGSYIVSRRSIGLWIWPGPTDPGIAMMLRGIHQELDYDRYRLVVAGPSDLTWEAVQAAEQRFLEQVLDDRDIAGVLLWYIGGQANVPALRRLREAGIPLVFLDRKPPEGFDADHVGVDNLHAANQVVRHLITLGHRRIAHVTNLDKASTVKERMAGFQAALRSACLPWCSEYLFQETEASLPHGEDVCLDIVDRAMSLPEPPTAFFAVNDQLALRLVHALRVRGYRVPEEVAVAGFDGVERWTPGTPFLTTALQPFERIGAHAVDLLLARIEGRSGTAYQHILLDAPLSVHGSTRAVRKDR